METLALAGNNESISMAKTHESRISVLEERSERQERAIVQMAQDSRETKETVHQIKFLIAIIIKLSPILLPIGAAIMWGLSNLPNWFK